MTKSYTFFADPGHGWLRVPVIELEEIKHKITCFSYLKGKYTYLEEDLDAGTFLDYKFGNISNYQELRDKGILKQSVTDNQSPIRGYESYHVRTPEEIKLMDKVINTLLQRNFNSNTKRTIRDASYESCKYWAKCYGIDV